ncbi:MAG: DNA polymerase I [uncultured bacterium]|nr:MAG: DNA polymerase I [uncultured bacterium]
MKSGSKNRKTGKISKLVVIDGFAILHRAYHALPPLKSKEGKLTNAVYGFFSMFLKLINDLKPEYITVCFDRPKPTFRSALYVGYQAHRPEMESDLTSQIELVHDALKDSKIKIFELDGYEADDLIGTIAKQVTKDTKGKKKPPNISISQSHNIQVIIVSGDRDLLQLVNPHVNIIAPVTGITKMIFFDTEKVVEKYGLKPHQFIDYKALVGDPSDNYPGVSGIGPKTASGLIGKYETFENIYRNLADLPQKIGIKLAQDAEQAALAKKLATIATDAPIKIKVEECSTDRIDKKELVKFFEKLGFKSLIERINSKNVQSKETTKKESSKKQNKENGQLGLL